MSWKDKFFELVGLRHYTKNEVDNLLIGTALNSYGKGDFKVRLCYDTAHYFVTENGTIVPSDNQGVTEWYFHKQALLDGTIEGTIIGGIMHGDESINGMNLSISLNEGRLVLDSDVDGLGPSSEELRFEWGWNPEGYRSDIISDELPNVITIGMGTMQHEI